MNGMITNPDKYQAMILGNATIPLVNDTNIWVKDNIELPGVNIDKNLQFNNHVKDICTKVNNQINVISRFRKIVPTEMKCKLYKAFIVSHFRYCSAVWHFCGARNRHMALRIVLDEKDEKSLHYQELLSKFNSSDPYSIRCQDMAKTVYEAIQFEMTPKYIHGLFQMWNIERNLRGSKKRVIAYVNTTTYGLHSLRYNLQSKKGTPDRGLPQIYFWKHMEQTKRRPEVINVLEWVQNQNMPNVFRTSMQL